MIFKINLEETVFSKMVPNFTVLAWLNFTPRWLVLQIFQHFDCLPFFLEYSWNIPYSKNFTIYLVTIVFGIRIFLVKNLIYNGKL